LSITTATTTIQQNSNRVGILFASGTATGGGVPRISIGGQLLTIVLTGFGTNVQMYSLQDHGDLPTKQFTITTAAGTVELAVTEFIAPTGMIAAGLDEFRRAYPGSNI
jgi:hypothetical protein